MIFEGSRRESLFPQETIAGSPRRNKRPLPASEILRVLFVADIVGVEELGFVAVDEGQQGGVVQESLHSNKQQQSALL